MVHTLTYATDYNITGSVLTLVIGGLPVGSILCIYRDTPTDAQVQWVDSSVLRASDLNKVDIQLLHLAEENNDKIIINGMSVDQADKAWEGLGRKVKNVADPTNDQDVATKGYIESVKTGFISTMTTIKDTAITTINSLGATAAAKADDASNSATSAASSATAAAGSASQANISAVQAANTAKRDRKNSTNYNEGDIAFSSSLPTWGRLECIVAGTTSATLPSGINSTATVGTLITDGGATWIVDDVRSTLLVGVVFFDIYLHDGCVKANGATVSRSSYPRLAQLATNKGLFTDDTANNLGLYGSGDGSTTMVLPNWVGRVPLGAVTGGATVAAGLPNITSEAHYASLAYKDWPQGSFGAMSLSIDTDTSFMFNGSNLAKAKIGFDASKSNAIYGASATVQPPAINVIPQIKY